MNAEHDPAPVNPSHPIRDFFLGFLITLVAGVVCFFSIITVPYIGIPASIVLLVAALLSIVIFFFKRRSALAVGICSALAIPLLLFGTCTALFMNMNF